MTPRRRPIGSIKPVPDYVREMAKGSLAEELRGAWPLVRFPVLLVLAFIVGVCVGLGVAS